MKKVILPIMGLLFTLSACQMKSDSVNEQEPLATETQLPVKGLVHAVYFDVLDSLSTEELVAFATQLKRLEQIKGVQDFKVGAFQELGDPRALNTYEWAILMTFSDSTAYRQYQQHPTHLEVKKAVGPFLAGKPASYDFVTQ